MPEGPDAAGTDFEPARIIWFAPLTIISAIAAWLVTVEMLTRLA